MKEEMALKEQSVKWPNGARCAVMLTFDLDAETTWANGNTDFPNGDQFIRSLSLGQYGPLRSAPRLLDLLKRYQLPATFFVPGWVAEHYPDIFIKIAEAGHDVGHHGYTHERFVDKTPDEQREIIAKSQGIFKRLIGKEAIGYRTPSGDWSRETAGILNDLGFSFSSSMRGDDRPYRTVIDGKETDLIEIPAHWELDDYVPAEPVGQARISSHDYVFDNFRREFEGYYRFGLCYVLMMHPQVIGKPGRAMMLERLIQHMQSYPDVWFATGSQIADWWRANY
jgi:peptidoglycan/xylan/chitin deacetylase (PgdA/CDA1 family)